MTPDERAFLHQSSIPLHTVNRALVLFAALSAGFWGGHKFLLGARLEGWLYLLLSWTSISVWMAIGDFFDLLRLPAIGHGFLKRRLVKRHLADAHVIEKATLKRLGFVVIVMALLIAAMVGIVSLLDRGEKRVRTLCEQINIGMPATELAAFATANGLRISNVREGFNVLADATTLGRHSCHVHIESGRVKQSNHHFID